jgi:hypothetical protein
VNYLKNIHEEVVKVRNVSKSRLVSKIKRFGALDLAESLEEIDVAIVEPKLYEPRRFVGSMYSD